MPDDSGASMNSALLNYYEAIEKAKKMAAHILETAAGDCTVHYSHTLHGAPPPKGGLALGEDLPRCPAG